MHDIRVQLGHIYPLKHTLAVFQFWKESYQHEKLEKNLWKKEFYPSHTLVRMKNKVDTAQIPPPLPTFIGKSGIFQVHEWEHLGIRTL